MQTNDENQYVQEAKYDSKGEQGGAQYSMNAAFPITSFLRRAQYTPRRRSLYEEKRPLYIV